MLKSWSNYNWDLRWYLWLISPLGPIGTIHNEIRGPYWAGPDLHWRKFTLPLPEYCSKKAGHNPHERAGTCTQKTSSYYSPQAMENWPWWGMGIGTVFFKNSGWDRPVPLPLRSTGQPLDWPTLIGTGPVEQPRITVAEVFCVPLRPK